MLVSCVTLLLRLRHSWDSCSLTCREARNELRVVGRTRCALHFEAAKPQANVIESLDYDS